MKGKKGISPLIATVLIIGFTIVLAALVITWGTGLFKRTVAETETVSKFNLLCTTGVDYEGTSTIVPSTNRLYVNLVNKKALKIDGFYFIAKGTAVNPKAFITDTAALVGSVQTYSPANAAEGVLDAFATKTYEIDPGAAGYTQFEVRPIVAIDTGEKDRKSVV